MPTTGMISRLISSSATPSPCFLLHWCSGQMDDACLQNNWFMVQHLGIGDLGVGFWGQRLFFYLILSEFGAWDSG